MNNTTSTNTHSEDELLDILGAHRCEDGRTLICLAGDEFYLSPAAEIDLVSRITYREQAIKKQAEVEGRINEARAILGFPPNTLTLFKKAIKAHVRHLEKISTNNY